MLTLALLFLISFSAHASPFNRMAFTMGGATREQQVAVDASRFWQFKETKFYFGTGIRLTNQWAQGQSFRTAPAVLTRGQSGLGALIRPEKNKNIDDVTIGNSQVTSLNVLLQVLYKWNENWSLGGNIDLIGASFGKLRKGKYNPEREDGSWELIERILVN